MFRKLFYPVSFLLVLGVACNASTDLVAHWKLDEDSGTTAFDTSGNGNDGTFTGDPQWVAGYYGGALEFDGADDNIDCGNDDSFNITDEITLSAWINMSKRPDVDSWYTIPWKENAYSMYLYGAGNTLTTLCADFWLDSGRADIWDGPDIDIPPNDWTHIAVTFNGTDFEFYVNGEHDFTQNQPGTIEISAINFLFTQAGSNFAGLIDDVRLYNRALTHAEILAAMEGGEAYPYALSPVPKDSTVLRVITTVIRWVKGAFAESHNVYFGDNFDDVNDGTGDTFRGNQIDTYYVAGMTGYAYPDGLIPGTTYFWRIDEVNDTDPNSPWKGKVWSFMVSPRTAYNPDPADGAEFVDPNAVLSWSAGFAAIFHTVYFGTDYDVVDAATGGTQQAATTYTPLAGWRPEKVYYWRVDEDDTVDTYKGDIWSFTTPGAVGNLVPANGATDVKMTATLSWTPADSAASHELYFGTEKDVVRNADKNSLEYKGPKALGAESYDPGKLAWYATYYWRVDEVDSLGGLSKGPLWSFTTADFISVDDFEDYDIGHKEIWWAWKDGLGYVEHDSEPAYSGNGTGSAVGDETTPSYMEETIVHGGGKSMPLVYDNNTQGYAYYSEVELTLSETRNWTDEGVNELSLWFRGGSSNSPDPLYVAVANKTGTPVVVVHDNPAGSQIGAWTEWIIPLQTFADQGIILTDVDRIAIGLGTRGNLTTPGGAGKMYFDDIRLDRPIEVAQE
jgi:hypothetical protein